GQSLADERERRAGAERVPVAQPDLEGPVALAQGAQELVDDARLADAGGRRHERGLDRRTLDALAEEGRQRLDLPVPAHADRGLAEQRARPLRRLVLAEQGEPLLAADHLEARVEKA